MMWREADEKMRVEGKKKMPKQCVNRFNGIANDYKLDALYSKYFAWLPDRRKLQSVVHWLQ